MLSNACEKTRLPLQSERKRKHKYGEDLLPVIEKIWYASGSQNTKSLHALLDVWYERLKKFGELREISLTPESEELLLGMSESTLSRMLKLRREANRLKGLKTTKAGTMLLIATTAQSLLINT
ncbi:hypothetical protein FACS189481_1800 [Clostridia bacterium]|nr:hypothetical protein FACS189481_1800 [Clostridia bacterium]